MMINDALHNEATMYYVVQAAGAANGCQLALRTAACFVPISKSQL